MACCNFTICTNTVWPTYRHIKTKSKQTKSWLPPHGTSDRSLPQSRPHNLGILTRMTRVWSNYRPVRPPKQPNCKRPNGHLDDAIQNVDFTFYNLLDCPHGFWFDFKKIIFFVHSKRFNLQISRLVNHRRSQFYGAEDA